MSVLTEVTRLEGAKADIKTAIENKGVSVPSEALLDAYAPYIDLIETGGIPCTVTVTTAAGATVTATLEDSVVSATADENGMATLILEKEGVWTITSTLDGETVSTTIEAHLEANASLLFVDPVLENNTWEKISQVAKSGKASEFWNVGDTKTFTFNNLTYEAQIIGFDHDDVEDPDSYGRAKAGITFQFKDLYKNDIYYNNTDSADTTWIQSVPRSTIQSYLNNGLIDTNVKNAIVEVIKQYEPSTTTIATNAETVFLLSTTEFLGNKSVAAQSIGSQYAYYAAGNSVIKYYHGTTTAATHWTRSRGNDGATKAVYVKTDGTMKSVGTHASTNSCAIAFCV